MARQKPEDQLLAIALLNHADDEGYFHADENIVRGSFFPFRESSRSITVGLQTLAKIGWIELSENPLRGKIGRVVNWSKHQKINHPSASKIKIYWITGGLREDYRSLPEKCFDDQGAGSREQGKEQGKIFLDAFEKFWEVYPTRKGKKVGKKTARDIFLKQKSEDLEQIISNAKNYGIGNDFPKDPERFLKDEFWKDWSSPMNNGSHQQTSSLKKLS